jgi:hypothetical protein
LPKAFMAFMPFFIVFMAGIMPRRRAGTRSKLRSTRADHQSRNYYMKTANSPRLLSSPHTHTFEVVLHCHAEHRGKICLIWVSPITWAQVVHQKHDYATVQHLGQETPPNTSGRCPINEQDSAFGGVPA